MLNFLRKLFRRKPPSNEYLGGLVAIAEQRGKEILPCCGSMRRVHAHYRSGLLRCPKKITPEEYVERLRKHKYNPLAEDTCYYPPWGEVHFKCDNCGCQRGVHVLREDGNRGACEDPWCPSKCGACKPP